MKRFTTSLLLFLLALTAAAQRPRVGVVLCGGGAKGAAHVGVLKVLEENDIPVDLIVGTSMGAIVGGLYAIGYSAAELDSLIMAQDWNFVMSDRIARKDTYFDQRKYQDNYVLRIPFGKDDYSRLGARPGDGDNPRSNESFLSTIPIAMVNGQNIYNLFTRLSVGYQDSLDFNRMPIPFACVAVDLIGKKEVVFHSGNFVDAIRSSMAIPGYFSPVRMDDMVLIDGGALNNYPVDVARSMGADIVIGVKLGELEKTQPQIDNIGDLLNEALDLYMDTKLANAIADTDILITPSVKGFGTMSFDTQSLRTLIDNGEKAAREKQEDIAKMKDWLDRSEQNFIGPIKQPAKYRKAVRLDRDTITLGYVSYNGLTTQDAQWLLRKSPLKTGQRISGATLESEIARFYNTGAFQSVTYLLKGQSEPYDMELNFVGGRKSSLGMGLRFDSEEVAAILVNVGFNEKALYGSKFTANAKLAYNMQANLEYSYAFKSLARFNLAYGFRHSSMYLQSGGLRSMTNFKTHDVTATFSTEKARNIAIDLGGQFLWYRDFDVSDTDLLPGSYDYDFSRDKFLSAFARFQFDRRDQKNFPTRGTAFDGQFNYYLNRLFQADGKDFSSVSVHYTNVFPMGSRMACILTLDNRTLLGSEVPVALGNVMGGALAGRYIDQQIPFIGFGYSHLFKNVLSDATLDFRYRMLDNHYFFLSGAYALAFQNLKTVFEDSAIYGARLGYAYNSFIGPLAFNLYWSNYTHAVGVYVSLGYNF